MKPVLLSLILFVPSCSMLHAETVFQAVPSGDDTSVGSEAKPFATLERVRDAVQCTNSSVDS